MKYFYLSKYLKQVFQSPISGCWFGYYNYDPLNKNQTKLLCNRTQNDAVSIQKGMTIEIGYYDIDTSEWHQVGTSDSFNWQQGAMAQWLPSTDGSEKIIYNTSVDNHIVACVHDVESGKDRYISWGIYGLTPDGKKSIAVNLERSYWCRAYHYQSVANPIYDVNVAQDDGIFEIDIEQNKRKRIISIQDIIAVDPVRNLSEAKHWLEHVMISPTGKRFCFLHRFCTGDVNQYTTRLFVANIDGSGLQLVSGWRDSLWSHFGWDGDDAFAIYRYGKQNLTNLSFVNETKQSFNIKKVVRSTLASIYHSIPFDIRRMLMKYIKGQQTYYQYFKISDDRIVNVENFDVPLLDIDGHPSFSLDGNYMITDSYPDGKQYQRLIVYNKSNKKALLLAKIYASLHEKPGSCDLHPKLCRNNDYLAVDSAYDGIHHLILYKLNWKEIINDIK